MKLLLYSLLITFFIPNAHCQDVEPRYYSSYDGFEPLPTAYLFGDNVKLRSEPNSDSEVLSLLKIGTEINILKKTDQSISLNGLDSYWYKVKVGNQIGYISQGLISLEKLSTRSVHYYFSMKKAEDNLILQIRYTDTDSSFITENCILSTNSFSLKLTGNKGLEGIDHILLIDLLSEACGVEGGGTYYFHNGESLKKAFEYSQISDAGAYWFYEEFIFPNDEKGNKNTIYYERSQGQFEGDTDEEGYTVETIISREFSWNNGNMLSALEKFRQKLNEDE